MAGGAVLFVGEPRVQAAAGGNFSGDFFVAFLAFQFCGAFADHMATGTVRGTA